MLLYVTNENVSLIKVFYFPWVRVSVGNTRIVVLGAPIKFLNNVYLVKERLLKSFLIKSSPKFKSLCIIVSPYVYP